MKLENNRATGISYGAIYLEISNIIIKDSVFWKTNIYEESW
jgi:hypothetical protein